MKKKPAQLGIDDKILALIKIIMGIFLFFMLLIPIYMPQGLIQLSTAKKDYYYTVVGVGITPCLVIALFRLIKTRKIEKIEEPHIFALAFVASTLISYLLSEYKSEAFYGTNGWYLGALYLVSIVAVFYMCSRYTPHTIWFIKAFVAVGVIISLGCILAKINKFPLDLYSILPEDYRADYLPFVGQKNWYAAYIALVFPLAVGLAIQGKGKKRIKAILALLFILPAMVLQDSDSIYISAAMVILFYLFAYGNKRVKTTALSIAIISPIILLGLIILNTTMGESFILHQYLPDKFFTWSDSWGTNRGRNWEMAIKAFEEMDLKSKLFGIGPDCYDVYLKNNYEGFYALWNKLLDNAHNEVLTMLITQGIVGLITYFGFFISCLIYGIKNRTKTPLVIPLCGCIVGWFFNNFFSFMTITSTTWLFILMGFMICLKKKEL